MDPAKPPDIESIVLEIVRTCSSKAQKANHTSLNLELDTELIESGALDSIALVELMIALADRFGLAGRPLRESFQQSKSSLGTPRRIVELVRRLESDRK